MLIGKGELEIYVFERYFAEDCKPPSANVAGGKSSTIGVWRELVRFVRFDGESNSVGVDVRPLNNDVGREWSRSLPFAFCRLC